MAGDDEQRENPRLAQLTLNGSFREGLAILPTTELGVDYCHFAALGSDRDGMGDAGFWQPVCERRRSIRKARSPDRAHGRRPRHRRAGWVHGLDNPAIEVQKPGSNKSSGKRCPLPKPIPGVGWS